MWKYKGTKQNVRRGDTVQVSMSLAKKLNEGERAAVVTGLHGFITVQFLTSGESVDCDARQITFVRSAS